MQPNPATEEPNTGAPAPTSGSNSSYSNQPPPMYASPPPSYGSYQGPPQGQAPPYGAPQGNRPPPAYTGGGRGNYNQGGPRRGWGGQGGMGPQGANPNTPSPNNGPAPVSDGNSDGNAPSNGSNGDRNERESNVNQTKYKTKMCSNFLNGQCSWGNNCAFAHGDYEMRFGGSPNASNSNAPSFAQVNDGQGGNFNPEMNRSRGHPNGAPPSYDRSGVPPPYSGSGINSSPSKPPMGQRTPPPMVPVMGGFPAGGAHYAGSPISPRSPIKISSPTGTGQGQRFRYEPYSGLGKAFSSDNLQGMASGAQSPQYPQSPRETKDQDGKEKEVEEEVQQ